MIFDVVTIKDQAGDEEDAAASDKVFEPVADMVFTLDFFNFPLIDNTRLSHNQRFALVLQQFDLNSIRVEGRESRDDATLKPSEAAAQAIRSSGSSHPKQRKPAAGIDRP